jgi:hypothetical protein
MRKAVFFLAAALAAACLLAGLGAVAKAASGAIACFVMGLAPVTAFVFALAATTALCVTILGIALLFNYARVRRQNRLLHKD